MDEGLSIHGLIDLLGFICLVIIVISIFKDQWPQDWLKDWFKGKRD